MINPEIKSGDSTRGTDTTTFLKQPTVVTKKAALRDVQNDNKNLIYNKQDNLHFVVGKPISSEMKFSGVKRQTPERPSSSPNQQLWSNHSTNEHLLNVRRRFELELGKGRFQTGMGKYSGSPQSKNFYFVQQDVSQKQPQMRESAFYNDPVSPVSYVSPTRVLEHKGPATTNFLGKHGNGLQVAEPDSLKVTSDIPHSNNFKDTGEQPWKERFIHLQNFLKQSSESNQSDYIQMLLGFSPAELSRHAVELEKKAIQLAIDEGTEMQRMKALNVLGNLCQPMDHQKLHNL